MAHHQIMGWKYLEALRRGAAFGDLVRLTDYYPPLYYLVEAGILSLIGASRWLALLSNLPGLFLLGFFTFRLTWDATGSRFSALAGHLALMMPLVAWTSRESLLDTTLAGLVAAALFLVVRSRGFEKLGTTLLLGAVCAAGMLLKWTFVLFLLPAVAAGLWMSRRRMKALANLLCAGLIVLPPVLAWYLPNLASLQQRFASTAAASDLEMDPAGLSWLGIIYYPRSLSSYYLFLPLTLILVWALRSIPGQLRRNPALITAIATLAGGLLLLTALRSKDPRYIMPLAGPLALVLVAGLISFPRLLFLAVTLSALQFGMVSFSPVPLHLTLFSLPNDTDFASMRQEWVWFATDYFGVTGPPRHGDWRYDDILQAVQNGDLVGFLPDSATFHGSALLLRSIEDRRELGVVQLGSGDFWQSKRASLDWVVGKTGFQGVSFITRSNAAIYEELEQLGWPLTAKWEMPDGSQARLWRNPTRSR